MPASSNNKSYELPLVSVVVPVYNGARFVRETITSVLEQSYPNIELIVLDDGSTDETKKILASIKGDFYWESHENIGQAATQNKGWQMSRGDILAYLSADDILEPEAVSESVKFLYQHPEIVLVYCDYFLTDENGKIYREIKAPEFNYRELLTEAKIQPGPGAFFLRSSFEKIGGWDPSLRQVLDWEYWLRLGLTGDFKRLPKTLARYRIHPDSLSYSPTNPERADESTLIIRNFFSNNALPEDIIKMQGKALSCAHLISARYHLSSGRFYDSLKNISFALCLDPSSIFKPRTYRTLLGPVCFKIKSLF